MSHSVAAFHKLVWIKLLQNFTW